MNNKKVFIYSIPRHNAETGIGEWVSDTSGKKLKKTKIGNCKDSIAALYSPQMGGLKTGLYKPWIENGIAVKDEKGNELTLEDKYEREFNKEKGFFTNKANLGEAIKEEDATYFQKLRIELEDGCTVLDLNHMDDLMRYHICLESKYIANSEKEWKSHKYPHAKYYIAIENEMEDMKYQKNELKSSTFALLHTELMNESNKRKMACILELINAKTDLSSKIIHNILFDYIDKSSFTQDSNIEKFKRIYGLLELADGKVKFENMYLLKQLTDYRIVYEKQGSYTWIRSKGSITIGDRYDEALDFLANPKKSSFVEEMTMELKAKMI